MTRFGRVLLFCLFAASIAAAQDVDFEKAVQNATKAGDLAKAKQLCDQWAEKKPNDERPYLILGRLYVKLKMHDKAIEPLEMARALNPLNPEPICELGRIFLEAEMAEEAIAEFQAALEVRKDYAPALKGLTEAQGLRDSPYPSGVRIKFGEFNEERGLKLMDERRPTRVATIGGRECRATDKAQLILCLDLDVSDDYLHEVDVPVRVTVEYYDVGTDRLSMQYDSTDFTAYKRGASKVTETVTKTNTKTWKKYTFNLPDARFARRDGRDFVLWCDSWRQQEDLYVSSVHVVQGGLQARVEPLAATAGGVGVCTVTAKVLDANGPVPDGTPVHFKADRGTITPKVETVAGLAKATFKSGDKPGETNVAVWTDQDRRIVTIPVLRGVGKIVRRKLLVHPFGGEEAWRISGGRGTALQVEPAPERSREGRPATRVVYKLRQDDIRSMAGMSRSIPLPGRATKLSLWVHLDQSPNTMHVELKDATGQTHGYLLGTMAASGWQRTEMVIGAALHHRGGADDGRLHFPLEFHRLIFRRYYGGGRRRCEGEVYLQDLTVETDIPGSETLELAVTAGEPNNTFRVGKDVAIRARVGNLLAEPRSVRLRWTVVDGEGHVAADGRTEEMALGPETRTLRTIPLKLAKPGLYRATLALEVDDAAPDARPDPPSRGMTFLLLNDSADLGLPAEVRPRLGGADLCLSNRLKEAAQSSLSYYVLNEQREILRKGTLGQPDMTLQAGETVECRLKLDGLAPGRYSILLFLDKADGQRLTPLLPHEIFPNRAVLAGRVLGGDEPISGASVRARLVKRLLRRSSMGNRTIGSWHTQTDDDGKFTLPELEMPPDVDRCHISLDVVAEGYVDMYRSHSLSSLLPSRGRSARKITVRLKRGEKLTGRVIGADGEPVANARVEALSAVVWGGRAPSTASMGGMRRVQYYRPRETDADGRFELYTVPRAKTELTVHTSQWAAKRVTVPTGQPDAGDIQLEAGATVSGVLLDEHGKPASGYWLVAEGIQRSRTMGGIAVAVAAKTGPDGAFTLPPLKGQFVLSAPVSFLLWPTEAQRHSPSPRVAILPRTLTLDRDRVELELRGARQVRIAGRVLDVDGTPAEKVTVYRSCPGTRFLSDDVQTDDEGHFALEGIPSGLGGFQVMVPTIRSWKKAKRIYLRAKPLDHVKGADENGWIRVDQIDEDLLNVDFRFQFWSRTKGFLGTSPDPALMEDAAPGKAADERGRTPHDLAKRLAQGNPLVGRVLDEAGKGVRGAQIRVLFVRRANDGEAAQATMTGPWQAVTGADGRYACAAVPAPKDAKQYTVRLEIVAKGYATKRHDFPLPELLTSGARRLRVPDLRLARLDGQ